MATLLISDLHLDPAHPEMAELFFALCTKIQSNINKLYILGDLFEAWIGDESSAFNQKVMQALRQLTQQGMQLFIMRGNRDFLLDKQFAKHIGATLLPDPCVIDLYGQQTLLTHGDQLCVQDKGYQRYRRWIQHPCSRFILKSLPLKVRQSLANTARQKSIQHQTQHTPRIMDIHLPELNTWLQRYQCQQIIHGHTHRPAIHLHWQSQEVITRYVLSDWQGYGNGLWVTADQTYRLINFQRNIVPAL